MKIRNLLTGITLLTIIGITSCRDDFDYDLASDELRFSRDTISLDTVFNHTNSQTYKFTVHNRQKEDVEIPKIYLSRGENSYYRINVDGRPGFYFENIPVRGKDSIFIFVEIAAGEAPVNSMYEDEINFETTKGTQRVKLISWIEKAKFYTPAQGQTDHDLNETVWDNSYSRVVFGNLHVTNSLQIIAGTRVYFHSGASLTINENASFYVQGTLGNEVRFRSDRHDERSDSLPNMWNKIHIKPHSDLNNVTAKIDYAIIKGGKIGLEVENRKMEISNTKILNNEEIGLYAKNADITAQNMVINNSNITSLGIEGGRYDFRHSTFANYFNIGSGAGRNYSLFLSNDGADLNQANFYNCIFYGRSSNAIAFENISGNFNHNFKNNVIRIDFPDELTGIDNSNISVEPYFSNSGFGTNDLRLVLPLDSPIWGHANPAFIGDAVTDINGVPRNNGAPLIPGAYQTVLEGN